MMKNYLTHLIILPSLLLFASLSLSAAKRVEGYIIMPEGDTLQAAFKVPFTLTDRPNYWRIQRYVKMYDEYAEKEHKTIKIYPNTVRELGFEYKGELIKLRSVYDEWGTLHTDAYHYNDLFLKVEEEGPLTLYRYHYKVYIWDFTEDIWDWYWTVRSKRYVMQKENGDLFAYRKWFFRKDVSRYLEECQEVANKIEDKQYRKANLKVIVNQYNKWYRYQSR